MRASGQHGELRVGYQQAAVLAGWEITPSPAPGPPPLTYTLRARVTHENSYWITQRPYSLALSLGPTEWVWHGVDVRRDDDGLLVVDLRGAPQVVKRRS